MSISSTESLMGDISKSILETNRPSKTSVPKKQPPKQQNETSKPQPQKSSGIQLMKQKQEQAAIIKAMKSSSMSPKSTPAPAAGRYQTSYFACYDGYLTII